MMYKKVMLLAVFAATSSCFSITAQAQYGGVQVRVGGYGTGVQVGGYGYGNGYYNSYGNNFLSGNGYQLGYGNTYLSRNGYQLGYGNYGQPSALYLNSGSYSGFRSNPYPTISYGFTSPRYYYTPARRFSVRRYR